MKGIPRIRRRILDGKKIIAAISRMLNRFSGKSSFPILTLNGYASSLKFRV